MIRISIENIFYKKLKEEIYSLQKEIKRLKSKKNRSIKYVGFKKGDMYVVNVCALYFVSYNQIILTSKKKTLLRETKGNKYRPIIITEIKLPNIKFIALSTFKPNLDNENIKKVKFKIENCKFYTTNCFLSDIENNAYIFGKVIKRKINGKTIKHIKGLEYTMPILSLKELQHMEASPRKEAVINKCEIPNEDYKLIKKCAKCSKEYIDKVLKEIQEQD